MEFNLEKGSTWRQWDLHIHSPASFQWNGKRFDKDPASDHNRCLVDEMIQALNDAPPSVFAIMDYWSFEGWFALKRRLSEEGAPKLQKVVFPGIELRLMAPMSNPSARLNAHAIFSDKISDQCLLDFKSALRIELVDVPLSDEGLIRYARELGEDKLTLHGFSKEEVDHYDDKALEAGSRTADINVDSYKNAINSVADGQAIGYMPFDTNDGLEDIKWENHYSFAMGLFRSSPIFESRNEELRHCFLCQKTEKNKAFIHNFTKALRNVPRLVVSGSDAHRFKGKPGNKDLRGYGDFPSGKITWIKSDPTFLGLRQAIMEPANRSFVGELPPKARAVSSNKTLVIDNLTIKKCLPLDGADWLDNVNINFNPDLVAIIGNKGSGKSALADIIALLGNSKQKKHFSFLQKNRFRGKLGAPAKHFSAKLTWLDLHVESRNLNEDPPDAQVEMVRYIPQGHFEDLCNGHASGSSNAFEDELRSVVFSHASPEIKLGALDFAQLIESQESAFRNSLLDYRNSLHRINHEIEQLENQSQSSVRHEILSKIEFNRRQIDEHVTLKPAEVARPTGEPTTEDEGAAAKIDALKNAIKEIDVSIDRTNAETLEIAEKTKAAANTQERLRTLARAYDQFVSDTATDLSALSLSINQVVEFTANHAAIKSSVEKVDEQKIKAEQKTASDTRQREEYENSLTILSATLKAPELEFQKYTAALKEWTDAMTKLIGTKEIPNTRTGLETQLEELESLPGKLEELNSARLQITANIFGVLEKQRVAREALFEPVQGLIQRNELIRDEYKLQFQAKLKCSASALTDPLFGLVKQNSGEFRGAEEGIRAIQDLVDSHDLSSRTGILSFVTALREKLGAATNPKSNIGIASLLRKEKSAASVYDLVFGLSFIEPKYSLLFQDAQIEQLSPGQRGALLLIFYLLVDKGAMPIILDQPEENLDNETVVNLLVPVLNEAKTRRQIFMVTHNPNLAVVCDAEQLIWSTFTRKHVPKISYMTGSIENPEINLSVVKILEGTMPAFNNRRSKYHQHSN